MRRFFVLALLCAAIPASAQFKSAALKPLDPPALAGILSRVRSIRAEPATLTLRVGQTVPLDAITVIVVDTGGKDLGRLTGFDFGIPRGAAAEAVPRKITGKRAGTADLTLRFPTTFWKRGDARPFTVVKVTVKP